MSDEALESDQDSVLSESQLWRRLHDGVVAKAEISAHPDRQVVIDNWYSLMVRKGRLSDRFKLSYYWAIALTSLIATAVPTLIAATGSVGAGAANVIRIVAAVLGVLVAVVTSVIGVVQVGNRWRVTRTLCQDLEEAGWDYLASRQKNADEAFHDFFAAVNRARRRYGLDYLSEVAVIQRTQTDTSGKNVS
jgi:Protein of unknown function (DUF4231)